MNKKRLILAHGLGGSQSKTGHSPLISSASGDDVLADRVQDRELPGEKEGTHVSISISLWSFERPWGLHYSDFLSNHFSKPLPLNTTIKLGFH